VSDEPRGPLDEQPDERGWWRASDGSWYPPEAAETQPVPVVSTSPTQQLSRVGTREAVTPVASGVTSAGTPMICSDHSATGKPYTQPRWRAA